MKRLLLAVAVLSLGGTAWSQGKPLFFGQIEYWTKEDAFEKNEEEIHNLGADKAETDISDGAGVRFGAFLPTSHKGFEWGPSLGYIVGPKGEVSVANASPAATFEGEIKTTFLRALLELRQRLNMTDGVELRFRGGLGVARGEIEQSGTGTGLLASAGGNIDDDWTGFTWEISPSIAFVGERVGLDIGVVMAGFPKLSENDDFSEFEWLPFGIRVGLEF